MLKYKLSGAPEVNNLEYISCSIQQFRRPRRQRGSPLAGFPPPRSQCLVLPLYQEDSRDGADSWHPELMPPRPVELGEMVDAKLFLAGTEKRTEPSEPSFSQWPKWPPIYLQNGVTLPWK